MKKTIFIIPALLLLIVGVIVFFYPNVSNWLAERNHSKAIQEYNTGVSEASETALQQERLRAENYNELIVYTEGEKSVLFPEDMEESDDYFTILNTKGIMGYINIPRINVSLPIYHGTGENVLQKGVGHMANTALPIGGNGNHTVLTGHSGYPKAKLFNDLNKLKLGDVFYLNVLQETLAYEVSDILVINPTDDSFLISDAEQDYVSLVTCTPYGINSHRLIVRGSRIPYVEPTNEISIETVFFELESSSYITVVIIFIFLIIVICIGTLLILKNSKKIYIWIFVTVLFVSGSCFLAYPSFEQFRYQNEALKLNAAYSERMKEIENIEYPSSVPNSNDDNSTDNMTDYIYRQMIEYNERLFENGQIGLEDSESYEQPDAELKKFGYDEDMIGYIKIKKMNIELPIYLGASEENMKKGAVHLTNTSLPIGGRNTNAVIAAHRGINALSMFKNIEKLELGDEVIIVNFREELIYQVSQINIISPAGKEKILIQPERDMITLLTCHPYGQNYQRYIVYCDKKINTSVVKTSNSSEPQF